MSYASNMNNVGSIFDELGGPAAVARILNVGTSTASEMKRRGSIPVRWWPQLISAAPDKLSPKVLMQANAASREPVAAAR